MRKITEKELVIATHNKGKAREIAALLGDYIAQFTTAGELGLSEPVEDGTSFAENALIKARAGAQESGKLVLADDSGLAVAALGGEPGIYSARWAVDSETGERDFDLAMRKVQDKLGDAADRSAAFVCVLALAWPDGHTEVFEGRAEGQIVWPPRGDHGFGYDPIFVPDGYDRTFAEMEGDAKQAISHRADAFKKLVAGSF